MRPLPPLESSLEKCEYLMIHTKNLVPHVCTSDRFWILMPLPLYMPNPMSRASEPTLHVRFDATAATDGTTVTLPITHFAPSIGRHPSEWHYVEVDTQELGFQGYAFDRISFVSAMLPAHGLGAASRNIIFVDGLNIIDRRDEGGR